MEGKPGNSALRDISYISVTGEINLSNAKVLGHIITLTRGLALTGVFGLACVPKFEWVSNSLDFSSNKWILAISKR